MPHHIDRPVAQKILVVEGVLGAAMLWRAFPLGGREALVTGLVVGLLTGGAPTWQGWGRQRGQFRREITSYQEHPPWKVLQEVLAYGALGIGAHLLAGCMRSPTLHHGIAGMLVWAGSAPVVNHSIAYWTIDWEKQGD